MSEEDWAQLADEQEKKLATTVFFQYNKYSSVGSDSQYPRT